MAEIKLIDFLRAELNSFSGEEISIEDCNRITIRLWNMSNSNFQLCSEAINNLKSKNKKIVFFKNHSLTFLSKLSEKSGPWDFEYKLRTSSNTFPNKKNTIKFEKILKKFTPIIVLWTAIRLFFSFIFFGSVIHGFYDNPEVYIIAFSFIKLEYTIAIIGSVLLQLFLGYVCFRAALENSNVWTRKRINPFRQFDFSYWTK